MKLTLPPKAVIMDAKEAAHEEVTAMGFLESRDNPSMPNDMKAGAVAALTESKLNAMGYTMIRGRE